MFGIGGGEFLFIMIVALMFFGSDKIPEIARALGKGMAQLRNATNDVRNEIQKGMDDTGIVNEVEKAKQDFNKMLEKAQDETGLKSDLDQIRENFSKMNTDVRQSVQQAADSTNEPPEVAAAPKTPELPQPDIEGPVKRQS